MQPQSPTPGEKQDATPSSERGLVNHESVVASVVAVDVRVPSGDDAKGRGFWTWLNAAASWSFGAECTDTAK